MDEIRSNEPHSRLTRLGNAMIDTLQAHPEYDETTKCIIFIDDEEHGGIAINGYENDVEAIAAIFGNLQALFRVNGSDLMLVPVNKG